MSVLVAYTSKHGSTRDIAERIGETLRAGGKSVRVLPLEAVSDPALHEAVVIGSAVYVGSWMKEGVAFIRRHTEALSQMPVWLFSSGPLGDLPPEEPKQMAEFETLIHPRGHTVFGGMLDRGTLGFGERMLVKGVKAPYGDFRDWAAIEAWAKGIAGSLVAVEAC